MKILHIHSGNLFGGVETLLITLAKQQGLCSQMQPQFALCFADRLAAELQAAEAKVHFLGEVRVSRPWKVWKARHQLDRLLQQESFEVVVCHSYWSLAIFGRVVRFHQKPLVLWCHDIPTGQHWLEQWAQQTPLDLAIANSDYTLSVLSQLYPHILGKRLYAPVSYPAPFDSGSTRRMVRSQLNTPSNAVVIIQASRLELWKGQSVLLAALAEIQEIAEWVCWIVGGGQRPHEIKYLQALQAQAQALGLGDRVQFLGQRTDVSRLLVAADIYCQPNISPEPFGIVLVEALHAGLPIVTSAIGGALEVVDELCGQLVAPGDSQALSRALRSLIIHSHQRVGLAIEGPMRAARLCNPAQQINRLHELLTPLVEQQITA